MGYVGKTEEIQCAYFYCCLHLVNTETRCCQPKTLINSHINFTLKRLLADLLIKDKKRGEKGDIEVKNKLQQIAITVYLCDIYVGKMHVQR